MSEDNRPWRLDLLTPMAHGDCADRFQPLKAAPRTVLASVDSVGNNLNGAAPASSHMKCADLANADTADVAETNQAAPDVRVLPDVVSDVAHGDAPDTCNEMTTTTRSLDPHSKHDPTTPCIRSHTHGSNAVPQARRSHRARRPW